MAGAATTRSLPLLFGESPEPEGSLYLELSADPVESPGQVRYLLYYDELTGLFNRRLFTRRLTEEGERASEESQPLALLWLNVDRFRDLNDEYGRVQGDHVLAQVGAALRDHIGNDGIPARFAGDEFVILIPGKDQAAAVRLGEDLLGRVREQTIRLLDSALSVQVTLSGGLACFPHDVDQPEKLLEAAERASRQARRQGRNRLMTPSAAPLTGLDPAELARRFPCPAMVGRERLIEDMEEVLQRKVEGLQAILLLQGNGGVGKTRLLEALRQRVQERGVTTMVATSRPESVGQPFSTLLRGLEDLIHRDARVLPVLTAALDDAERTELGFLIPALSRPLEPGELPPSEPPGVPLRGAFVKMLTRLADTRPFMVALDDAQWAERGTMQVLKFLWSRKTQGLSLCLVVNTDDPESGLDSDNHPLFELVAEAEGANALDMISVMPLGVAHVGEMVSAILPYPVDDEGLIQEIHRRSGGNPLLVEEILKYLIHGGRLRLENGRIKSSGPSDAAIPEQEKIMEARTASLDSELRTLLSHAAALGREFDLDALVDMEGGNEGYVRGVLEEAARNDVIRGDGETFRFSSERMRQNLYQGMEEGERQQVHREIAETRMKQGGRREAQLSELAYHLRKGGEADRARQMERDLASLHKRCAPPQELSDLDLIEDPRELKASANRTLNVDELQIAAEAARHLRMLFKGVRMYGMDHPQVVLSQSQLLLFVEQFLRTVPRMDLAEGRQTMLVNGQALETPTQRVGKMDLVQNWNLQSLSFLRAINISEIRALTEVLSIPLDEVERVGGYSYLLEERGVKNVVLNEKLYVEVGERDVLYRRASDEGMMILRELAATADLDQQLGRLTGSGEEMPDDLPTVRYGADEETAQISVEELKRLLHARREVAQWYEEISKYIDMQWLEALSADWGVLVSDLESGNRIKIAAACRAFVERGADSIFHLTQFVARSNDARARQVALQLLRRIGGPWQQRLLELIHESPSPQELAHLLEATEDFDLGEVGETLVAFVSHSVEVVRREAIRILSRRDSMSLEREVTRLLRRRGTDLEVRIDCIVAAGRSRFEALVPRLIRLCQRTTILFFEVEPRLQVAACHALGDMGSPKAVPALLGALGRGFGLYRTKPTAIRAAAAMSLAKIEVEGPLATRLEKALTRASRDPDPTVRAASKLAVSQFQSRRHRRDDDVAEDLFMFPSGEEQEALVLDDLMQAPEKAPEPEPAPATPAPVMAPDELEAALAREFLQPIQPASEGKA